MSFKDFFRLPLVVFGEKDAEIMLHEVCLRLRHAIFLKILLLCLSRFLWQNFPNLLLSAIHWNIINSQSFVPSHLLSKSVEWTNGFFCHFKGSNWWKGPRDEFYQFFTMQSIFCFVFIKTPGKPLENSINLFRCSSPRNWRERDFFFWQSKHKQNH